MAKKKWAVKTRKHVIAITSKLVRKGATIERVMDVLYQEHPEVIRAEKEDLVRRGLTDLINEVFNLRVSHASGMQGDLFADYDTGEIVAIRLHDKNGKIEVTRKVFANLTKAELREYIAQHTAHPPRQSRRVSEAVRVLGDIETVGDDSWTVKQCLMAVHVQAAAM